MTEEWQAMLLPEGSEPLDEQHTQSLNDTGEATEPQALTTEETLETDTTSAQAALASVLTQFKRLGAPLTDIGMVRPAAADAAERIEAALRRVPSADALGATVDRLRVELREALERQQRIYTEEFRRHEAAFIHAVQEAGSPLREQNDGWRIGAVELEFRRGAARARALFNHEEIVRWGRVTDVSDLEQLEKKARTVLERAALPDELLIAVVWDAYTRSRTARITARRPSADVVPVLDFYRELRIALARYDLDKRPAAKLAHSDMPKWSFLYNLDRYRALGATVPADQRLGFQTGSQAESTRGRCVTLNGLDATQDYKEFCHLLPPRGAAT
ncbi:MAG: hypothetical protein ACYDAR_00590 [Thermomicrobiales bacterium]